MIIVDIHEPKKIAQRIKERGIQIHVRSITPGDYIVGDVGVERKTLQDFYHSIIKKRLFRQIDRLRREYLKCLLLLEGNLAELDAVPNPRIFWGAFIRISLDMNVPIIFTSDLEQTISLLCVLDKRIFEEKEEKEATVAKYKPPRLSEVELQRYILMGLPYVGEKSAIRLLKIFGTVRNVFKADKRQLMKAEKIGEKKSEAITRILDLEYPHHHSLGEYL